MQIATVMPVSVPANPSRNPMRPMKPKTAITTTVLVPVSPNRKRPLNPKVATAMTFRCKRIQTEAESERPTYLRSEARKALAAPKGPKAAVASKPKKTASLLISVVISSDAELIAVAQLVHLRVLFCPINFRPCYTL